MHLSGLLPASIVALAALLLAPAALTAQSILLTAADFTLLGGSAVTSTTATGTVISNGDVGLAPGATSGIVGFPPAVIINGALIPTGGVTTQARLDLIAASVFLAGLAADTDLTGADLGGLTLAGGVYHFESAAGLTGALILDAQGQNNVSWIFQIGTTLTASANSSVTVTNLGTNGGADNALFWNAGTEITFGANSDIAGNYLSGTSITLGVSADGGARLLALAAISLDQDQIDAFGSPGGGDWTGGLASIPEPTATLWLAPLAALGFAVSRRRSPRIM